MDALWASDAWFTNDGSDSRPHALVRGTLPDSFFSESHSSSLRARHADILHRLDLGIRFKVSIRVKKVVKESPRKGRVPDSTGTSEHQVAASLAPDSEQQR